MSSEAESQVRSDGEPDAVQVAVQRAVDAELAKQSRLGNPIIVWENGEIRAIQLTECIPDDGNDAAAASPAQKEPNGDCDTSAGWVVSDSTLRGAFEKLTSHSALVKKLSWWLGSGFSAERWLQFEYAHALQETIDAVVPGQYLVYPEHYNHDCRVDIAVVDIREQKSYRTVVANIEMKMNGNWYTERNTFPNIQRDIDKVGRYGEIEPRIPAVALSFWIVVALHAADWRYEWIRAQIRNRRMGRTRAELEEHIGAESKHQLTLIAKQDLQGSHQNFEALELWLYGFRNTLADA